MDDTINARLQAAQAELTVRGVARDMRAEEAIARAETALGRLSSQFASWIDEDIAALVAARDAAHAASLSGEARERLYRMVHELRGQGTLLGYPLVSRVAESLCNLIDRVTDIPPELIDQHVDAIRAIVHETARGDGTPLARKLVTVLADVTEDFVRARLKSAPDAAQVAG